MNNVKTAAHSAAVFGTPYHTSLVGSQFTGRKKSGVRAGAGQVRGRTGEGQDRSVQGGFRSGASQIRVGKCQSGKTDQGDQE